jgi:hypothetical protein
MGIGVGLVLTAAGAILAFAVDVSHSHGFNINAIGYILMVVGLVGVLLDLMLFMPRRRRTSFVGSTSTAPATRITRVDEEV